MTSEENADSAARAQTYMDIILRHYWARNSRSLYDYDPIAEAKEFEAKMKAMLKEDKRKRKAEKMSENENEILFLEKFISLLKKRPYHWDFFLRPIRIFLLKRKIKSLVVKS